MDGRRLPSRALLLAVVTAGVVVPGVLAFALTRTGHALAADAVWVGGYALTVVVVWYGWFRHLEFAPAG